MALIVLDTNAYSALKRGDEAVASIVRASEEIVLSAVVVGELVYGFRRGVRYDQNLEELRDFASRPYVRFLPVSWVTADRYARVAATLRNKGKPIPTNDIWIAAHAMESGGELISFDTHFEHVDGLVWRRPAQGGS